MRKEKGSLGHDPKTEDPKHGPEGLGHDIDTQSRSLEYCEKNLRSIFRRLKFCIEMFDNFLRSLRTIYLVKYSSSIYFTFRDFLSKNEQFSKYEQYY